MSGREIFQMLVLPTNGHKSEVCTRLKAAARNSILLSYMSDRGPSPGPGSAPFPGLLKGGELEGEQLGFRPAL